jgi:3-dehydroquinate dehydratase/shikimate dehydrogenase
MLCVPVSSESRTLVKADLLNASRAGDLVELCLDQFARKPTVDELIASIRKPVIVSCRRRKDGGRWPHSEEERLELLQEALAAGPAVIELELDVAAKFPKSSKTKRLIAINSPFRALSDLPGLLEKAANVGADYVKLVWPGVLLDSMAPVLEEMLKPPRPPIVGIPIGHAARSFAVLARKCGAPWVYAALERGMESHEGMPIVRDLDDTYRIRAVDHDTKLVGIIGFGVVRDRTVQVFNAACQDLALNLRCIPLEIGPVEGLEETLDTLHISAVMVTPNLGDYLFPLVEHPEPAVALGQHVDLLLRKRDGWHGFNVLWRSALKMLERTLRRQGPVPQSLEDTQNLVLGAGRLARSILFGLKQLKGSAMLASPQLVDEVSFCPHCGEALTASDPTVDVAKSIEARYVPFAEISATRPDVLIVTEPGISLGFGPTALNPLFLQPEMTVLDISHFEAESDLLVEARDRGCVAVRPSYVLAEHLATQFKAIVQQDLPDACFRRAMGFDD